MIKKFICIQCPRGCQLEVDTETMEVKGNSCPRGKSYGISEATHPVRTITSTVKVENGRIDRCSCKTNAPVPKEMMMSVMHEIDSISIKAPIEIGSVLIKNVCSLGVDVIATKSVEVK